MKQTIFISQKKLVVEDSKEHFCELALSGGIGPLPGGLTTNIVLQCFGTVGWVI